MKVKSDCSGSRQTAQWKAEPTTRLELVTSSLPRTRSYHLSYVGTTLERETGLEPATNSLEGCDSTTELLPPRTPWMWWREEDSNLRSSQGAADLQSAAINHSAISPNELDRWSWRRDLNPRPSDYKSDALPAELRQPVGKRRNVTKTCSLCNKQLHTYTISVVLAPRCRMAS